MVFAENIISLTHLFCCDSYKFGSDMHENYKKNVGPHYY